jgi:hypothetical protein
MSESISAKYKVPAQLRPLLEAFARETLRAQPDNLIEFGRTFFDTLHLEQKGMINWGLNFHGDYWGMSFQGHLLVVSLLLCQ